MPQKGKQTGGAYAGAAPDPRDVLAALHGAAPTCRKRIPNVTLEVERLAGVFGMLPAVENDFELGFRALRGFQQALEAVNAYLATTLEEVVANLPPVMEPKHIRSLHDYLTLSRLQPLWDELAQTQFFQQTGLAANLPDPLVQRKSPAVTITMVFNNVRPVLREAGIRTGVGPNTVACRATAALISSFTDYKPTVEAVSKEVRRQSKRQAETKAWLEREGMIDPG
jgi:hypothetical protein